MLYKTLNNNIISVDKISKICYSVSKYDKETNSYQHLCFVKNDNILSFINIFSLMEV